MKANRHLPHDPISLLRRVLRDAERVAHAAHDAATRADEKVNRLNEAIRVLEGAPIKGLGHVGHAGHASNGKTASRPLPQFAHGTTVPLYDPGETMIGYARRVIETSGRSLHIKEIVSRMMDGGFPASDSTALRQSLVRTLDRKVENKKGGFTKPAAATYGLAPTETSQESLLISH